MATVNDFIETYLGIESALNQRRALSIQARNSRLQRIGYLQGVAQGLTDPAAVNALAQAGAYGNSVPGADLQTILQGSAPGPGVTQRGLAREGAEALSPEERARLASEAVTREATGVGRSQLASEDLVTQLLSRAPNLNTTFGETLARGLASRLAVGAMPGQVAQDAAIETLSPAELTEQAGIAGGTRLSEGQLLEADLTREGREQQQMQFTIEQATREELQREQWGHEWAMLNARLEAQARAAGDFNGLQDLQNFTSLINALESNKFQMSETEIDAYLTTIKHHMRRLSEGGYDVPEALLNISVDDIRQGIQPFQWMKDLLTGAQRTQNRAGGS